MRHISKTQDEGSDDAKAIRKTLRYIIIECLRKKPPEFVILDNDLGGLVPEADVIVKDILYKIHDLFYIKLGQQIYRSKDPSVSVQNAKGTLYMAAIDDFLDAIEQRDEESEIEITTKIEHK